MYLVVNRWKIVLAYSPFIDPELAGTIVVGLDKVAQKARISSRFSHSPMIPGIRTIRVSLNSSGK